MGVGKALERIAGLEPPARSVQRWLRASQGRECQQEGHHRLWQKLPQAQQEAMRQAEAGEREHET